MAREKLKTLTEQMYYILPLHGYAIMERVKELTCGRVIVGAGTLYTLLSRFEEEDIIKAVGEQERRKTYTLTDKGRALICEEYERLIRYFRRSSLAVCLQSFKRYLLRMFGFMWTFFQRKKQ